jgi:hypothetical protein
MIEAMQRVRRFLNGWGFGALVVVVVGAGMMVGAYANGIHCPDCDQFHLGDRVGWWRTYFQVKDVVLAAGGLAALPALILAERRRWALLAFVVFLPFFLLQPR